QGQEWLQPRLKISLESRKCRASRGIFLRSGQDRKIATHGDRESLVQRFADQRMPDRNLRELRNGMPEGAEILLVEVVTRIHRQPCRGRMSCRDRAVRQLGSGIAMDKGMRIRSG